MKDFEKCGTEELTRLEQRETVGGDWRSFGRSVGRATARLVRASFAYFDWVSQVPVGEETWLVLDESWGG